MAEKFIGFSIDADGIARKISESLEDVLLLLINKYLIYLILVSIGFATMVFLMSCCGAAMATCICGRRRQFNSRRRLSLKGVIDVLQKYAR